jgi:hypothetical protein
LEELTAKRYQPLVIHIVDEQELQPKARGDVALVDVEAGRERKFFLDDDLVRRFQAELASYFKEIETMCASRRIDYPAHDDAGALRRVRLADAAPGEQRGVSYSERDYALVIALRAFSARRGAAADLVSP